MDAEVRAAVAEWEGRQRRRFEDGAKRKVPAKSRVAHLAIESNVREPFQRLADTGLRLNALRTAAAIQT